MSSGDTGFKMGKLPGKLSNMRTVSRMGLYFALFVIAQVTAGVLIAITRNSTGPVGADPNWLFKVSDSSSRASNPLSGDYSSETAHKQSKFVQQERSWLSMVYHDETTPELKSPKELFNTSVHLEDFCKDKRNQSRVQPKYAVFRNTMFVAGELLLPSTIDCNEIPERLSFSTLYHVGQNSTPQVEARVVPDSFNFESFESAYSCHERVYEPSVFFSFINWPQHGHALFNAISLLWEAFDNAETGPLFRAGKNVRLYAFGDKLKKREDNLEWQQYFPFIGVEGLEPLMTMFSHLPIRSLASLFRQSKRHPVCFTYLLVGISGELDHYNYDVPLVKWRNFANAVREHFGVVDTPRLSYGPPLERHTPPDDELLDNTNESSLGEIRPVDWTILPRRPRLVIIDRKDNRLLLNVKELFEIAKRTPYFKSVEIVYFEEMEIERQIQLVGETDVLFGMDGTGLMNGMFMPEGGIVVHLRPYGCAEYLQGKGLNFDRLFSAHPGRVIRYESGDRDSTVFPLIKELPELVFNRNSTPAYRYPFILRQNTRIDTNAFRCILDSADKLLHGVPVDWTLLNQCTRTVFLN